MPDTIESLSRLVADLRHGRRQFHAHVMVSITGPDLREAGLRVVTPPPTKRQRTLFSERQRDCE